MPLVALVCLVAALGPAPALAIPATAGLTLSDDTGPPTTRTTASGSGFEPSEAVRLTFDGTQVAKIRADGEGSFTKGIVIPSSAKPGGHIVTATGRTSHLTASATFTVRTDWPMFRYSVERSGANPYENTLSPANVGSLVLKWKTPLPSAVDVGPSVVDGVVYAGDTVGNVDALDAKSGEVLWERSLGGIGVTESTVLDGIAYVGNDLGATVFALDITTGESIWQRGLPGTVGSSPAVADDLIYVGVNGGDLYALDAVTGAPRWHATGTLTADSPAVADDRVFVGGYNGKLQAFDALTGTALWFVQLEDILDATPAVVNGVVYIANSNFSPWVIYAIDADDGTILWSTPTTKAVTSSPTVVNGVVYVNPGDPGLMALDAATGAVLWTAPIGGCSSSPAVANGVVYVGSQENNVYAVEATTGEVLWSYSTSSSLACASPAVADGVLYAGSNDHYVYAFGLP